MMKEETFIFPTRLIKSKKATFWYVTRKNRRNNKSYLSLPRWWDYYYQTPSTRSRRKWKLKRLSNRKIRRDNVAFRNWEYKRIFDLPRILD